MKFYANRTRYPAIVTLHIESIADNSKATLRVGSVGASEEFKILEIGYYDFPVDPGKEIRIADGMIAIFLAVRSAT